MQAKESNKRALVSSSSGAARKKTKIQNARQITVERPAQLARAVSPCNHCS